MNYVISCFSGAYPPEQDAYRKRCPGGHLFLYQAIWMILKMLVKIYDERLTHLQ